MTTCWQCGKEFIPAKRIRKFCSLKCFQKYPAQGTVLARFWSRVNKEGPIPSTQPHLGQCWLWTKPDKSRGGYGRIKYGAATVGAHCASWMIHVGRVPKRFEVCHKCDNPPCVRPDHLFLGTRSMNQKDSYSKGRHCVVDNRGEKCGTHKLTEAMVLEIRKRVAAGERNMHLSAEYGVVPSVITNIYKRRTWAHI